MESMDCPKKNHGPMKLVEKRGMYRQFACEKDGCGMRFKVNTATGEAVQVAAGIAAIGTIAIGILSVLFGGDGGDGGA